MKKNDPLIEELRKVMKEKSLSTIVASKFVEAAPKSISRWLNYEARPMMIYRKAIKRGIKRMERLP